MVHLARDPKGETVLESYTIDRKLSIIPTKHVSKAEVTSHHNEVVGLKQRISELEKKLKEVDKHYCWIIVIVYNNYKPMHILILSQGWKEKEWQWGGGNEDLWSCDHWRECHLWNYSSVSGLCSWWIQKINLSFSNCYLRSACIYNNYSNYFGLYLFLECWLDIKHCDSLDWYWFAIISPFVASQNVKDECWWVFMLV